MQYIGKGIRLANKSLYLYFFGLILVILDQIGFFPKVSTFLGGYKYLVYIIFLFLVWAYDLSVPAFLLQVQKEKFTYKQGKIYLHNLKRFILPAILLNFILALVVLAAAVILVLIYKGNRQGSLNALNFIFLSKPVSPFVIIAALLSALSVFQGIFFSIKKRGFWDSLKSSFKYSFDHPKFFLASAVIYLLFNSLAQNLSLSIWWVRLLNIVILHYVVFATSATALIFYQDKERK